MIQSSQPCPVASTTENPMPEAPPRYLSRSPSYTERMPVIAGPLPSTSKSGKSTRLDLTQRFARKLAEYDASENVLKRWLFEIMSWLVSAMCMVAIIVIYVYIKDRPMSNSTSAYLAWVNVLGKVASAALIVPTSEALGQLKWNWFHSSKTMWDFEIFDKASRGPWGALMLLFRTKGRSLAALGAVLILLLLAIDTFFQQVTNLHDRWIVFSRDGVIPLARRYGPEVPQVYVLGAQLVADDKDMFSVVEKFAYGNGTQPIPYGNATRPEIPLSCPTSNCTWPVYETLGVCSQCTDITSHLKFACLNNRVDWTSNLTGGLGNEGSYPNATMCGYFLNLTSQNPIMMSGYIVDSSSPTNGEVLLTRTLPLTTPLMKEPLFGDGSINFKEFTNTITDVLIVSAANGSAHNVYRNETPVAQECMLTWCVKSIQSKYEWGGYEEKVTESFYNTTSGSWPWMATFYQDAFANGTDIFYLQDININSGISPSERNISGYGISNSSIVPVVEGFTDFFPAYTTASNESASPLMRYKTWSRDPAWTRSLKFNPWLAPNNITRHMERFATAMTNVVRSSDTREMLSGHAWRTETYILVRWEWLAFPLALLVLSLIFLVSTIIRTSKNTATGVWKTSAMPTLIYSLPKETQSQFTTSSTWSSNKETKKIRIRLLPNMSWRVSGQNQIGTSPRILPPTNQASQGWV